MEDNLNNQIKDLTTAHFSNKMQISAFKIIDEPDVPIYGINISKVKSFEMTNDIKITKTMGNDNLLMGIGHIRNDTVSIVNLGKWLGEKKYSEDPKEYKYTVLCEFNETKIAFVCNKIIRIYNKNAEELEVLEDIGVDNKITYITKIDVNDEHINTSREQEEELCLVLDVEKMLSDFFPNKDKEKIEEVKSFDKPKLNDKLILVAEDSETAVLSMKRIFEDLNVKFMFFKNGESIINWLSEHEKENQDVGLIITDLEMPIKDGYRVIDYVKNNENWKNTPLYAHSSMSNVGAVEKTKILGVNDFIPKFNPKMLLEIIKKHLEK